MLTFSNFDEAKAACPEGCTVAGTYRDNKMLEPVYFHVASSLTDDEVHDVAFEVKHGHQPTDYQRWVSGMAQKFQAYG